MKKEIEEKVIELIEMNEITKSDDGRIETHIADRFPGEYSNDQEYVAFQMEIGKLVDLLNDVDGQVYAKETTYEPPHSSKRWGASCIELSSDPSGIKVSSRHLNDIGMETIKSGKKVLFFSSDISYGEIISEMNGNN